MTKNMDDAEKKRIAVKVTIAVMISVFIIYLFGKYIFYIFGITLDAFRIGAGTILFLSGLSMVQGKREVNTESCSSDIAVVPLAIPITVGPGVIGVLLVMGAEAKNLLEHTVIAASLFLAVLTIGIFLYISGKIKRIMGDQGLTILAKITGLFVSAIAAQIIFTGIKNFLILK